MVLHNMCLISLATMVAFQVIPVKSIPQIVIVGGKSLNITTKKESYQPISDVFDTNTEKWSQLPELPQSCNPGGKGISRGAAVLGSNLYVTCRVKHKIGYLKAINSQKKAWVDVKIEEATQGVSSIVSLLTVGEKMYVLESWYGKTTSNFLYGDPVTNKWERGPRSKLTTNLASCTVLVNHIYKCSREDHSYVVNCETYDTSGKKWSVIPKMKNPHDKIIIASLKGQVYAIGGGGLSGAYNEVFDPTTQKWSNLPTPPNIYRLMAAVTSDSEYLYVFGGRSFDVDKTHYNAAEKYDPSTQRWTALEEKMPHNRVGGTATLFDWLGEPEAEACDPEEPECGD